MKSHLFGTKELIQYIWTKSAQVCPMWARGCEAGCEAETEAATLCAGTTAATQNSRFLEVLFQNHLTQISISSTNKLKPNKIKAGLLYQFQKLIWLERLYIFRFCTCWYLNLIFFLDNFGTKISKKDHSAPRRHSRRHRAAAASNVVETRTTPSSSGWPR